MFEFSDNCMWLFSQHFSVWVYPGLYYSCLSGFSLDLPTPTPNTHPTPTPTPFPGTVNARMHSILLFCNFCGKIFDWKPPHHIREGFMHFIQFFCLPGGGGGNLEAIPARAPPPLDKGWHSAARQTCKGQIPLENCDCSLHFSQNCLFCICFIVVFLVYNIVYCISRQFQPATDSQELSHILERITEFAGLAKFMCIDRALFCWIAYCSSVSVECKGVNNFPSSESFDQSKSLVSQHSCPATYPASIN